MVLIVNLRRLVTFQSTWFRSGHMKKKKKMNLFGYTCKIYDIGYKTEMMSKECNSGDPLATPGGLYRGPPSNENTIFKKMCMPNIKFKSVQCSFSMNVNQLQ